MRQSSGQAMNYQLVSVSTVTAVLVLFGSECATNDVANRLAKAQRDRRTQRKQATKVQSEGSCYFYWMGKAGKKRSALMLCNLLDNSVLRQTGA